MQESKKRRKGYTARRTDSNYALLCANTMITLTEANNLHWAVKLKDWVVYYTTNARLDKSDKMRNYRRAFNRWKIDDGNPMDTYVFNLKSRKHSDRNIKAAAKEMAHSMVCSMYHDKLEVPNYRLLTTAIKSLLKRESNPTSLGDLMEDAEKKTTDRFDRKNFERFMEIYLLYEAAAQKTNRSLSGVHVMVDEVSFVPSRLADVRASMDTTPTLDDWLHFYEHNGPYYFSKTSDLKMKCGTFRVNACHKITPHDVWNYDGIDAEVMKPALLDLIWTQIASDDTMRHVLLHGKSEKLPFIDGLLDKMSDVLAEQPDLNVAQVIEYADVSEPQDLADGSKLQTFVSAFIDYMDVLTALTATS